MRAIPQAAIDFLKAHEGCELFVYDDARSPPREYHPADILKGTLTAGYGHTGFMSPGDVVSQARADAWLASDLTEASAKLAAVVDRPVIDALTDNQYSALLAFVFNLGAGKWTIWKVLNAKQFDQVPLEMMKFVNAGGKKLQGLVNRRAAEVALWATGEPGTVDVELPSSVTRSIDTAPTPSDPTMPSKSKTIMTGALGAVATVPVAVKTVSDAIAPYADKSPAVANMLAILASIAAGAVCLTLFFAWLHNRNARN